MDFEYDWDEGKDLENRRKHGLALEDGIPIFRDNHAIEILDEFMSEQRLIRLGLSPMIGLLVVVYCERYETVIRLISVRKATKKEQRAYEERI